MKEKEGSENKNNFTVENLKEHFSYLDSQKKSIDEETKLEIDNSNNTNNNNNIQDNNKIEENTQKSEPIKNENAENKKENCINPENYVQLMRIGEGNFSEVFLVENKDTKLLYALKQFVKRRVEQLKKQEEVLMEKYVMNKVSPHKYLIGYGGSYKDDVIN